VSIGAISGGGYPGSVWDYYQELKAAHPGAGSAGAQGSAATLASSSTPSSMAVSTTGKADAASGFGQLLSDVQALAADYTSASGSASDSIAHAGTVLSSGGTLSTALLTDLGAVARDLTSIFNGQNPPASTADASGDTSAAAAAVGSTTDDAGTGVAGHRHHGRHGFETSASMSDEAMTQGVTLTASPNADINQLVAQTASPG
jgi:hypothetical protein